MKKMVVLSAMFIASMNANAQMKFTSNEVSQAPTITNVQVEQKVGPFTCKLQEEKKGTSTNRYLYMHFQNAEYQHITDIASITFYNEEEKDKFISELTEVLTFMDTNRGTAISLGNFRVSSSFPNSMFVYGRGGYTMISKGKAKKLIAFLESVEI